MERRVEPHRVEVGELGDAHEERVPRQLPGSTQFMHVPGVSERVSE